MLRLYTVSFFGHRIIEDFNRVEKKAETLIRDLILQKEYVEFLVGRGGDFDQIVSSAVKRLQRRIRADNSSLVWVLPYPTAELRNNGESFSAYYDEIEICHIPQRNCGTTGKVSLPIMTKSRSVMPLRITIPREPIKSATGRWWIGAIWWFSMWSTIQAERIRQCGMHKKKENGSSISPSDKMMNKKSSIACGKCCFGESA